MQRRRALRDTVEPAPARESQRLYPSRLQGRVWWPSNSGVKMSGGVIRGMKEFWDTLPIKLKVLTATKDSPFTAYVSPSLPCISRIAISF